MRRPAWILILCLLAGSLAWWELRHVGESAEANSEPWTSSPLNLPSEPSTQKPPKAKTPDATVQTPGGDDKTGPRFKRAYILSLDKGALTFLEAQDIEGDFAKPRRKPEEWSGMLRCRLMSDSNVILAEELLPAPDHLCAVLDPNSGSSKPVQYSVAGPVVFQVRLPRVKGATRLDVSRIIQPADSAQPGFEGQLGSIPLPRS